ncbi:DoxX family membrane protein [uncultured Lacinutrix sp.]|uniref:DoxX family membrane protein n=1 Tax=uncultured Lacinutrix sp. TaxID=574032 RepID=UPI0026167A7E|nr:DoxX family membrane protein [uncultured Lacinutrix sp.]
MNSKVFMILRILLGIFVLIFGINKFLNFLPAPEGMSADAGAYFGALVNSKTMVLVAIVEIAAGLALILNKFGALMALILMSVSVNAVLFHAVLDPGNIIPALALLALNIVALIGYKDKYKTLLS